jgi:hypothetical protein
MGGGIPLRPLHSFMASTGTDSPMTFYVGNIRYGSVALVMVTRLVSERDRCVVCGN